MSPSRSVHPMDVPVLLLLTLVAIGATCTLAPSLTAATDVDTPSWPAVGSFPPWLPVIDDAILDASPEDLPIDVVVSQDGTGNYTTVMAAVDAAPPSSGRRYVVHIRRGTYDEYVSVEKPNVVFIGDGMGVTVITGSHSVADGWTTFNCGTVIVSGLGFIARDLTITNTAGPTKGQAVALRSSADLSVFYRCSFEGYQDTLYAHANKQFYRECRITGTVDFIFGDAAAVFQFCLILARRPLPGQENTITAQGRDDIRKGTGFTLQNCNISADSDLAPYIEQIHSYLGRPWQNLSRTVVMETYIGSLIRPEGWLEWNGSFALDTLYYGEYMNSGPGSGLRGRVKWPGYHIITDPAVAANFTVARLIDGDSWLPSTGISYKSGL